MIHTRHVADSLRVFLELGHVSTNGIKSFLQIVRVMLLALALRVALLEFASAIAGRLFLSASTHGHSVHRLLKLTPAYPFQPSSALVATPRDIPSMLLATTDSLSL
jgi:hypothetical protein